MAETNKTIEIDTASLISEISTFRERGITEFTLHDEKVASDKKLFLRIIDAFAKKAPDCFVSVKVNIELLDKDVVQTLSSLYCSLEIPLRGTVKNGKLLFDKKLYSSRAGLLNNAGIVFGFDAEYALQEGDTFKSFRDRINFALTLYPNHIDFAQIYNCKVPGGTGVYSSKDIDFSRGMAFALVTFYSAGRAVPWFNTVLSALKIDASSFFCDFEEWQQCNNCSYESGFNPESASHKDIEKMQLMFLKEKFEEKNKSSLFIAVQDLVRLNGAFSRVAFEGEECVIETSYNPDDILSPYALDLVKFCDNVTQEDCSVKIFEGQDSPDYKIL